MARPSAPLLPGSRVWAYLRVSGDEQADRGLPIAGQRQRAQEYERDNGLIVVRWFVDEAKSGGSTVGRDAFNEMIYLSRQQPRPVDGILIWDLKRFARNLLDSQFYKADLRRRGFTLIFLSDDIPETDFAPVYEALLEWKAEKDRSDIAKDAQRGLQALAKLGYAPGGFPPRGYKAEALTVEFEGKKRQVRRWMPDPQWWDLARKAWEMRASGNSLDQILAATHLYSSQNCLTTFFANRTYLGIRKCGELEVENAHEALITPATWDAVQKLRKRRTPSGEWREHPRRANSRYLLSGLLHCSACGAAMCGCYSPARQMADGHRAEWRFYICSRKTREHLRACSSSRIKADTIEAAVIDVLLRDVLTPDHLQDLLAGTNDALSGRHHDLTERQRQLQHQITQVEARIVRLLNAIEAGDSTAVRSRLAEREQDKARLLGELSSVDEELARSRVELSPAALQQLAAGMHDILRSGEVQRVRQLLRTFIVRIEADREGGTLYYTFPFPSSPRQVYSPYRAGGTSYIPVAMFTLTFTLRPAPPAVSLPACPA